MAEPKENLLMEKIVSLCKRRGFVFQSSEIYGGINGFWDYGPLGAELKRNVKELWWHAMTRQRDDVAGLEATIIMSPQIWKASGHVDTFSDPMCDCLLTKKRFRADQIEPQSGEIYYFIGACESEAYIKLCSTYGDSGDRSEAGRAFSEIGQAYKWPESNKDVREQFSLWPTKPLPTGTSEKEIRNSYAKAVLAALTKLAELKLLNSVCDSFLVLVPSGKPFEKGLKVAREYYAQRGIKEPIVFVVDHKSVENSTSFNPENGAQLTEPRPFNLMFKLTSARVESDENVAYLRPETAQAIFAQFKNVLETSRQKSRSASRRSARRSATKSRRAISPSARASSSRWNWNFSSSRTKSSKPFTVRVARRRLQVARKPVIP